MHRFELVGFLGALATALTLSGVSFARPPFEDGKPPRDPGAFMEEHAKELNLDSETLAAIREIVDESRGKGDQLHAKLREMHEQMRKLLEQNEPDEAEVMRQVDAIGDAETEMHRHRLATMLQIRALLTSEQREAMTRLRDESRGRWMRTLSEDCEADLETLCPGIEDRWARKDCLREKRDQVSAECREAIEGARRAHRHFRDAGEEQCEWGGWDDSGADCPYGGAGCRHHGPGFGRGADCPMSRGAGSSDSPGPDSAQPAAAGDAN